MNAIQLTRREMLKATSASIAVLGAQQAGIPSHPFEAELERPEIIPDKTRKQIVGGSAVLSVRKDAGGVQMQMATGILRLEPWEDGVIRVQYCPGKVLTPPATSAVLPGEHNVVVWRVDLDGPGPIVLSTPRLSAFVDRASGAISFQDASGKVLLQEPQGGGKRMDPVQVKGQPFYQTEQTFLSPGEESLYGLGGFWHGFLDHKGDMVQLVQTNPCDVSPFLLSSQGYAMLWDNGSRGEFRACREPVLVPASAFVLPDGSGPGLASTLYAEGGQAHAANGVASHIDFSWSRKKPAIAGYLSGRFYATWKGKLKITVAGDYFFLLRSANLGARLAIDRKLAIENWIAHDDTFDTGHVTLTAGEHEVQIEFYGDPERDSDLQLKWVPPGPPAARYTWAAEAAEAIDYYVFRAETPDAAIAGYRRLTGTAPLFPLSSYGLWHSQASWEGNPGPGGKRLDQIPNTQANMIAVAAEYRRRKIPVDNIVQDFKYWTKWGAHDFRPDTHPDPVGMMRQLHALHFKVMFSIWCIFDIGSANEQEMRDKGYLLCPLSGADWDRGPEPAPSWYNPWNTSARAAYWRQVRAALFKPTGVQADGFWMDSIEGTGDIWRANEFPLKAAEAVFEGWLQAAPERRVTILGRSIFPGIQRYAVALWSGDVGTDMWTLSRQIPNGLGVCMTGLPYWTTDIGGFGGGFAENPEFSTNNNPKDPRYVETYVRWFQFGSFCPVFRVHSAGSTDAPWYFGTEAEGIVTSFIQLRYRLMPYIYSVASRVTNDGYTIMRALPMDFMEDKAVRNITDQFMFGPALLINPVSELKATQRSLYLPSGTWYDFWTGERQAGGRILSADAPLARIPIFVRAGSIVPMGPSMQYTGEKPSDPIELRIYAGADGSFTLYEDNGSSYAYQRGQSSVIRMEWHDVSGRLKIGSRQGTFPSMLVSRAFHVVRVGPGSGVGGRESSSVKRVTYTGSEVIVTDL